MYIHMYRELLPIVRDGSVHPEELKERIAELRGEMEDLDGSEEPIGNMLGNQSPRRDQ